MSEAKIRDLINKLVFEGMMDTWEEDLNSTISAILALTNLSNELLPKVNGEYQCEHVKEKVIRCNCVWCNLTVAEKIIDRLKRELTNLKPLEEKEVLDLVHLYNYGSLFNGHAEDEINFAKCLCSHFSKPIVYPEKKEGVVALLDKRGKRYYKNEDLPKAYWNECIDEMRKLNGGGK